MVVLELEPPTVNAVPNCDAPTLVPKLDDVKRLLAAALLLKLAICAWSEFEPTVYVV